MKGLHLAAKCFALPQAASLFWALHRRWYGTRVINPALVLVYVTEHKMSLAGKMQMPACSVQLAFPKHGSYVRRLSWSAKAKAHCEKLKLTKIWAASHLFKALMRTTSPWAARFPEDSTKFLLIKMSLLVIPRCSCKNSFNLQGALDSFSNAFRSFWFDSKLWSCWERRLLSSHKGLPHKASETYNTEQCRLASTKWPWKTCIKATKAYKCWTAIKACKKSHKGLKFWHVHGDIFFSQGKAGRSKSHTMEGSQITSKDQ